MSTQNPFLSPSTLPYGLPPFAEIEPEHFRPAFEAGFAEQLAEVAAIVANDEEPTVANTLIPLETSGQVLHRVATVFYNKSSADSDDFTDELEEEIAPRFAAHSDAIRLDPALYARIAHIHEALSADGPRTAPDADPETRYLVERYFTEATP